MVNVTEEKLMSENKEFVIFDVEVFRGDEQAFKTKYPNKMDTWNHVIQHWDNCRPWELLNAMAELRWIPGVKKLLDLGANPNHPECWALQIAAANNLIPFLETLAPYATVERLTQVLPNAVLLDALEATQFLAPLCNVIEAISFLEDELCVVHIKTKSMDWIMNYRVLLESRDLESEIQDSNVTSPPQRVRF